MRVEDVTTEYLTPGEYAERFRVGAKLTAPIRGVCGRVIRGKVAADFERLAFTDGRLLAWLLGPQGMAQLTGQTGAEIVLGIGKTPCWLKQKIAEGNHWKLAVLPESECRLADWEGVFAMVREHYPAEVSEKLLRWEADLRSPSLAVPSSLVTSAIKDNVHHPEHRSVQFYRECEDTAVNARLFLWHSLGLNDQFTGTGRTRHPDGSEGAAEYLSVNRVLSEVEGALLIDLEVIHPGCPPESPV